MGGISAEVILLADADVLIDFVSTKPQTLRLVSRHVGRLLVLTQVLETVTQLTKKACASYGIEIVDVETDLLLRAGVTRHRALSFEDHLGLLACQVNEWTMVTNDHALIRACRASEVPVRRGLRLVLDLVAAGRLTKEAAKKLAVAIQRTNPHHINSRVLERFEAELSKS